VAGWVITYYVYASSSRGCIIIFLPLGPVALLIYIVVHKVELTSLSKTKSMLVAYVKYLSWFSWIFGRWI